MKYFTQKGRLRKLTASDWQLFTSMEGSAETATSLNEIVQASLDDINTKVCNGSGIVAAALVCAKVCTAQFDAFHSAAGAGDTEPRGVLYAIIEEYVQMRFEADIDVF